METLNLSDFVSDTIIQIAKGVEKAKESLAEYDVLINPATDSKGVVVTNSSNNVRQTQNVEFDLSVTIKKEEVGKEVDENKTDGSAKIQVVSLFNFSFNKGSRTETVEETIDHNMIINRIRFAIPISFGTNKPGTLERYTIKGY